MKKYAICSIYSPEYSELGKITIENNCRKYCEMHGYDCIVRTDNFVLPKNQLGYEKIQLILETLYTNKYDWVYWRGCDTMITNFNIKLDDLIYEDSFFIIAADIHGINADSFFIKNTPISIKFFEEILEKKDNYIDEQQAFNMLRHKYDFKIIPQKFINSYDYSLYCCIEDFNINGYQQECESQKDIFGLKGQWTNGDFLIHWPGISLSKRIELAKELNNII